MYDRIIKRCYINAINSLKLWECKIDVSSNKVKLKLNTILSHVHCNESITICIINQKTII